MALFWYLGLLSCQIVDTEVPDTGDPSEDPVLQDCVPSPTPQLEISQQGSYGLVDGDPLWFGLPPQGGVPYAPFRLRIDGLNRADLGTSVWITATDVETEERLGDIELVHRFVCANVGEDEGQHVAGEIHLRFWDYRLKELDGRTAEVVAKVEDPFGLSSVTRHTGPMVRMKE